MTSNIQEQEMRHLDIIDGVNRGITTTKIAERLGIPIRVVRRDLHIMKCNRDSKLKQAYRYSREQAQVKKQLIADLPNQRFHSMTGMTFKEKTFSNMMSFYGSELREILKAENESEAIRDLPSSVRKTLRRNGIITQVWNQITADARTNLTGTPARAPLKVPGEII